MELITDCGCSASSKKNSTSATGVICTWRSGLVCRISMAPGNSEIASSTTALSPFTSVMVPGSATASGSRTKKARACG